MPSDAQLLLPSRQTNVRLSDMVAVDASGGEKRVSIRLSDEDMARVKALALGDETLSQTVRRVLREASYAATKRDNRKK